MGDTPSNDQVTSRKDGGVGVTSVDDLPLTEEMLNGTDAGERDSRLVKSLREKLNERSKKALVKTGTAMKWAIYAICIAVVTINVVGAVWVYQKHNGGSFYTNRLTDERGCRMKVGDDYVLGRRYYSYRYSDIFGFRFIDTSKIEERTELFVSSQGYAIVGIRADKTSWSSIIDIGEKGVEPLEEAETYTVFSQGKVGTVTYEGFCSQRNPTHPLATITD